MSRISLDTYRARYEALPLTDHKRRLLMAVDVCAKACERGEYLATVYWATEAHMQSWRLQQAEHRVSGTRPKRR